MRTLRLQIGLVFAGILLAVLAIAGARSAAAQASGPADFAQFGYPSVAASVDFTPGTAATLTAGTQQVVLPADFISKTVKFELLTGDPSYWTPRLASDDQNRPVLAAWAFRVTDAATGARIGRFDKPVQWSVTDARVADGTDVYNTTAANPPVITENTTPGTISGTTFAHSFGGAGVGWLALGPVQPVAAPVPAGMPTTGNPSPITAGLLGLILLAALFLAGAGLVARRQGTPR